MLNVDLRISFRLMKFFCYGLTYGLLFVHLVYAPDHVDILLRASHPLLLFTPTPHTRREITPLKHPPLLYPVALRATG